MFFFFKYIYQLKCSECWRDLYCKNKKVIGQKLDICMAKIRKNCIVKISKILMVKIRDLYDKNKRFVW